MLKSRKKATFWHVVKNKIKIVIYSEINEVKRN